MLGGDIVLQRKQKVKWGRGMGAMKVRGGR